MDTTAILDLPYIDTHTSVVEAEPPAVWRALHEVMAPDPSPRNGFGVAAADPHRELTLAGRHPFATYAVVFRLAEAGPGRTRLQAESRARFPGPGGAVYRGLVVGSGGHAVAVRHLLKKVRDKALEQRG